MPVKESAINESIKWIDISNPTWEEVERINIDYGFHLNLLHDCLDPDHLPKHDTINNVHFLIVRYYNHTIDKRIAAIQELTSKIAVFYTDQLIVTIHRADIHFLTEIKNKFLDTGLITTTPVFVAKILWYVIDTFDDPVQRLSEQVDFYETHLFLKTVEPEQLENLYYIKRKAALVHKLLTLTLEPINHVVFPPDDDAALDDVKDHYLKVITLYNQVLDDVNNLMNLFMSFTAQKTNDVVKLLTMFSIFFMPLTFIAGIYGMNFQHIPELRQKWGYPFVLLLMAVIVVIIYFWFKKKKWL